MGPQQLSVRLHGQPIATLEQNDAGRMVLTYREDATRPLEATPLSERDLAEHIRKLDERPLFIGVGGLHLSLAGAQDKATVCLLEGLVSIPRNGTPTTHILKPMVP